MKNSPLLTVLLTFSLNSFAVIYGANDMAPITGLTVLEEKMSKPVAAMIPNSELQNWEQNGKTLSEMIWSIFAIPGGNAEGRRKVCADVSYLNELALGTCSGVLIAPNKIATASHCILGGSSEDYLKSFSWVFNYESPSDLIPENIYRPTAIELQITEHVRIFESPERQAVNEERKKLGLPPLGPDMMDFTPYLDVAIVRLDRSVKGIEPPHVDLNLQYPGTELTMIGHPMGLSKKITRGGKVVESLSPHYMTTTLDTVKGNSGGPVFNAQTGALVGLIVNQGIQYAFTLDRKQGCYRLPNYSEEERNPKNLSGYMNAQLLFSSN